MSKLTAPKIELNTDILRIAGHLYAVKRIEAKDLDINKELKELYGKKFEAHVAQLNEGCVANVIKDWDTQIERIRRYEGKNAKAIPERLFNKPVMIYRHAMLELRPVLYSPCEITGTACDQRFSRVREKIVAALGTVSDVDSITVTIKCPFAIPTFFGYDERSQTLYSPFIRGYHSFDDGRICTGNHTGKDFWDLGEGNFEQEINKVNLFSPANSRVIAKGVGYPLQELVNDQTFVSVRRRGADTWNVSR